MEIQATTLALRRNCDCGRRLVVPAFHFNSVITANAVRLRVGEDGRISGAAVIQTLVPSRLASDAHLPSLQLSKFSLHFKKSNFASGVCRVFLE